jgi:hypothetical protein
LYGNAVFQQRLDVIPIKPNPLEDQTASRLGTMFDPSGINHKPPGTLKSAPSADSA